MSPSEEAIPPILQRAISNIHPLARTIPDLHACVASLIKSSPPSSKGGVTSTRLYKRFQWDIPTGVYGTAAAAAALPGLGLFLALTAVDEAFGNRHENEFRRRSLKYRWMASAEDQMHKMIAGTSTPTTSGKAPASAAEVKDVEAVGKAAADAPVKVEEQEDSANSIMQSIEESPAAPVPGPNARLPASSNVPKYLPR